jgi:uncharacterized circularly permuted ATP-grasp superfamily protein/uncharacterized alpha-E superfamily protein
MLDATGNVRPHWLRFARALNEMGRQEFGRRLHSAQQIIRNNSITYNVYGDSRGAERLWPLDPIPMLISDDEWAGLEFAIAQRATLFNAILNDCYGPQKLIAQGKIPPAMVYANPNFLRPCHGFPVNGDIRLHFYGVDLARSHDGRWWVIADRTQVPSGAGYALENRLVSSRTLPNLFNQYSIRPLNQWFSARRNGLLSLAKGNRRMVLLTPGPFNETYFEHSYLAKSFAIPLVEGPDLTVRDHKVFLKTLDGLEPVDLILRRLDDAYCDPLELRGDSLLGVPGLLGAVRAGNVVIANALGSGLVESPVHKAFLPGLCRHLLGEELRLPSVATWWCGQETERNYVLNNLQGLVIKPAFPRFGLHPVFGGTLGSQEREELRLRILANPEHYIAQEVVSLSTSPVWTAGDTDGGLAPRHVMLRAYAAWDGHRYSVMPGGLTRVAKSRESLIVSMQQGGGSKDTWVLGRPDQSNFGRLTMDPADVGSNSLPHIHSDLPSRVADNLFWLGRYTERVESIIRLLRTVLPALSGEEDVGRFISLDSVLQLLVAYQYLPKDILEADIGEQLHQLHTMVASMVLDPAGMSSLGYNLKQIRRCAWPLKERLSQDTWRVLHQLDVEATPESNPFPSKRPAALMLKLDQAITQLSAFAGLLSDSTTRGHGWRFLEIGRRIERGIHIIELLRHGLNIPQAHLLSSLDLILQVADSSITYRSRYLTALRPSFVLELLLIDETNPRALAFQLASLVDLCERLPNKELGENLGPEHRLAIQALNSVRIASPDELAHPAKLTPFLIATRGLLFDLSESLTGRYLTHIMPSQFNNV